MASHALYPPIVDGYMPSFVAGTNAKCIVYFSLSKFNSTIDFKNAHVSVTKQTTGEKCIKPFDSNGIYRMAQVMLNVPVYRVETEDNLYYIEIKNEDLNTSSGSYNGWCPGWIYKIQLRLSNAIYDGSDDTAVGQSTWMNEHGDDFSEWSTVCTVKPIGQPVIKFTSLTDTVIDGEEIIGRYTCPDDPTELLYNYRIKLYDDNDSLLDDSNYVYADQNADNQKIDYVLGVELVKGNYVVEFEYNTVNGYIKTLVYNVEYTNDVQNSTNLEIMTLDTSYDIYSGVKVVSDDVKENYTSIISEFEECEDGRLSYFIYGSDTKSADISGIYYVRRTDSRSNFKKWIDIKKLDYTDAEMPIKNLYYDYTVESGVFYRYAIQAVAESGARGKMMKMHIGGDTINENVQSIRDFSYAYLTGKNEQQLRLSYSDTVSSYKITVNDVISPTLDGIFPYVTRHGNNRYRTFSISGIISFNADENKLFLQDNDLYEFEEVAALYNSRGLDKYDYTHEREYRNKVLKFLTDGKPKLYKSYSEGNILVRLTDVSCTPNQQLSRLVYNFTATATEIGDPTLDNYFKYKITSLTEEGNNGNPIRTEGFHKHSHE